MNAEHREPLGDANRIINAIDLVSSDLQQSLAVIDNKLAYLNAEVGRLTKVRAALLVMSGEVVPEVTAKHPKTSAPRVWKMEGQAKEVQDQILKMLEKFPEGIELDALADAVDQNARYVGRIASDSPMLERVGNLVRKAS